MPTKAKTMSQMKRQTAPPRRDNRPSAASRGYDYKWVKLRNWFIKRNPLCVDCLKIGITTAWTTAVIKGKLKRVSNEVDHIIPHKGNLRLKTDPNNLQTLCKSHHSRKTATEDGGFGN
jgi:5-methylcytosine-specific restriction protein A